MLEAAAVSTLRKQMYISWLVGHPPLSEVDTYFGQPMPKAEDSGFFRLSKG